MKARWLAAGSALATFLWAATAAAQSVTTAPFGYVAPTINVTVLFALAVLLTAFAWSHLRRQRANRAPGLILAALALACWTVAVNAAISNIVISGGDCRITKTNSFDPDVMTMLESDCPGLISIIALDNPCTVTPPCIAAQACEVGLVLGEGEVCDLPYCPHCEDGIKNQDETDVDCGGSECDPCALGKLCVSDNDCETTDCVMGVCKCPSHSYTFTVNSNSGGLFDSAEWPGGTQKQEDVTGCSVTINNPNANIDLICALANPFSVNTFTGYSTCAGTGGEDGDGCNTPTCTALAAVGSCCEGRPSCSVATNGSGSAQYFVQCNQ